jgi:endoglucanase
MTKKNTWVILLTVIFAVSLIAATCPAVRDNSRYTELTDIPVNYKELVPPEPALSIPQGSAMEFVTSMKIGWNLGNSLDAIARWSPLTPGETAWGNPPVTQSLLTAVAEYGFGAVRIPVTWGTKAGPAPDFIIDPEWLNRVEEVVEYARVAGLKAMINIHHDGADSAHWLSVKTPDITGENKDRINAQYIAIWTQIAEHFKETGNFLIFEGFNELHDGSWGDGSHAQRSRVNDLNQIFVDAVRATGGGNFDRYLVVSGWVTRPSLLQHLVIPNDPANDKLIVNFHYYDPYQFAIAAEQTSWGEKALPGNWANEAHVRKTFNDIKARFIDKGIPVIIGEYGSVAHIFEESNVYRKYYMEYVTRYAHVCGIIPFYWDNGGIGGGNEKFGLIRRRPPHDLLNEGEPILEAIMRAVNQN